MKRSIISLAVIVIIIAAMLFLSFNGLTLGSLKIPSVSEGVTLGLELVGGSEITYEAVIPQGVEASEVESGMESAQAMLRQRLDNLGYTESNVYRSGSNRIIVEIPSVENPEEAVQMIGTTAVVEFRNADNEVIMEASGIKSAYSRYAAIVDGGSPKYHVVLELTSDGQQKFMEGTKEAANRTDGTNYIAIYLDNEMISQPYVESKYSTTGIDSDTAIITFGNNADKESVSYIASLINSGRLPFTLENVKLQSVGASLGEKSLETSLLAGVIGLALVMLLMIVVYRVPGIATSISLLFYAGLVLLMLSLASINLSLPGIAGVILSIGMAVDANVIIFERIKEELRAGKTVGASIDLGFDRAFSAILDSNVTTAIAAGVLWWQGTGTIVGFAKTLLIGVCVSMFTMLVITKILLKCFFSLGIKSRKAFGA